MTDTRTEHRGRAQAVEASLPPAEVIQAWQCIGCGRIEAPQTCIGVCRDRKVFLVGKDEHDAVLAEVARLRDALEQASALLLRFERATPREGQWQRAYLALQDQVREVRAVLDARAGTR